MTNKNTRLPGVLSLRTPFSMLGTAATTLYFQPRTFPSSLPYQVEAIPEGGGSDTPTAYDIPYTPVNPSDWNPGSVPANVGVALDQLAARQSNPSPTWTFIGSPPLLGEGWYVSATQTVSRAVADATSGAVAADADGVSTSVSGRLITESGTECDMRLEPGLTGMNAPAPGRLLYTSWTTAMAGLFTTVQPPFESGNFQALRGKCVDVTMYDPTDMTGSPVLAIFRPLYDYGPV